MEYKKGLVEIVQAEKAKRCTSCNREVQQPTEIKKAGKVVGSYGSKCIIPASEKVIKANEASTFGVILPGLDFVDYFKRPKVRDIRQFERVEPKGDRRTQVLDAFLRLKNGQYLHVPAETELVIDIKNWRKKGYFIQAGLPTIEEINRRGLTPREVARRYIGRDFLAYAGLMYFSKADNRNRVFSVISMIEGRKIAYLCSQEEIEEKIEIESDQGPNKILWVPSTTRKGEYHQVKLKNLSVDEKNKYSRAFEFDFVSTSEDAMYNNLPWSNANMPNGRYYRFPPARPDKFAWAAVEYLMSRPDNDVLVDPRPVIPSDLACKLENRLLYRAVHGSELLDGQEIEVQLWMAANKRALGYDKMFKS
ncbi:hypothetical protein KY331_00015 [Candidatus Woesearchaeota archaeon]|nr:hypothetical protein [Candidatus Woesearchaeota archaeon]